MDPCLSLRQVHKAVFQPDRGGNHVLAELFVRGDANADGPKDNIYQFTEKQGEDFYSLMVSPVTGYGHLHHVMGKEFETIHSNGFHRFRQARNPRFEDEENEALFVKGESLLLRNGIKVKGNQGLIQYLRNSFSFLLARTPVDLDKVQRGDSLAHLFIRKNQFGMDFFKIHEPEQLNPSKPDKGLYEAMMDSIPYVVFTKNSKVQEISYETEGLRWKIKPEDKVVQVNSRDFEWITSVVHFPNEWPEYDSGGAALFDKFAENMNRWITAKEYFMG